MKKIIHVNQHVIRENRKLGKFDPVLTVKTYKSNEYAHEAFIVKDGDVIGKVIYSQQGLSCGAKVWIEFDTNVVDIVTLDQNKTYSVEEKCKIAELDAEFKFKGKKFDEDGNNTEAFQTMFDVCYDSLK